MQVKKLFMEMFLVLSLQECLVECAKICDKSEVTIHLYVFLISAWFVMTNFDGSALVGGMSFDGSTLVGGMSNHASTHALNLSKMCIRQTKPR